MRGPSLDADTVARIKRLSDKLISDRRISELTDVPFNTVRRLLTRIRSGKYKFVSSRMQGYDADIERLTAEGHSIREIGRRMGIHESTVINRRRKIGLDAETAAELRQDARQSQSGAESRPDPAAPATDEPRRSSR